jgi:membrane-bound lytic murein transglycosylase D
MTWSSKLKPILFPACLALLTLVGCGTTSLRSNDNSAANLPAPIEKRVIKQTPQEQTASAGATPGASISTPGTGNAANPSAGGQTAPVKPNGAQTGAVPSPIIAAVPIPAASSSNQAANAPAPIGKLVQSTVPTPASSTAGATTGTLNDAPPLAAVDLWDRMRSGFKMNELNSPLVTEKEKFYLSKPDYLKRMFNRGNRYLYFIMEEIDKRGMPMELALLPFVESAMNPTAMSHASASGLWQFIPSTGRQYNLSQNWWVDNRRDVSKATIAALEYLDRIYKMQGNDWFLALASYNWGEGSVQRAMRANAAKGLPTDYVSLNMPNETRHYVPKLIALRNIVMRSKELGLELPEAPNEPYFVSIEKTRPIDLKLAAQFAGMSVEEFVSLNPAHNRPVIAASKNNQILIPTKREKQFLQAIETHADGNKVFASWQPRTLSAGESLESIAAAGGVSVAELRQANSIKAHQRILPGTRIIAPQSRVKDETQVESFVAPRVVEAVNIPAQRHVVGKKETLKSIAGRYGVSIASLKAWNGIKKAANRGMSLIVRPAVAQTVVTNEAGSRQVVSSNQARIIPVVAKEAEVEEEPKPKSSKASRKKTKGGEKEVVAKGKKGSKGEKLAKGGKAAKGEKMAKGKSSKKAVAGTEKSGKANGKATAERGKKRAARA